jgi:hypothetical protein
MEVCQKCAANSWKSTVGSVNAGDGVDCTTCTAGKGTGSVEGSISESACKCAPGYFTDSGTCSLCLRNTYKSTTSNTDQCLQCTIGTGTNGVTGATSVSMCTTCQPGYQKIAGSCTSCPKDTYKDVDGDGALAVVVVVVVGNSGRDTLTLTHGVFLFFSIFSYFLNLFSLLSSYSSA